MEILGIQIASVAFSIFMIYFTYLSYKRGYFEIYTLLIWLIIFASLIVASLFPKIFAPFAELLKFARLFDLFVVIGLAFLLIITFLNFIHTQKMKVKIEKFIQESAIKEEACKKTKEP